MEIMIFHNNFFLNQTSKEIIFIFPIDTHSIIVGNVSFRPFKAIIVAYKHFCKTLANKIVFKLITSFHLVFTHPLFMLLSPSRSVLK